MRYPVYRSLDRPSAFFGIRGRFIRIMVAALAAGLMLSFIVGRYAGKTVSLILFLACGFAAYMAVQSIQGKMSERAFARRLPEMRQPRVLRIRSTAASMMRRREQ